MKNLKQRRLETMMKSANVIAMLPKGVMAGYHQLFFANKIGESFNYLAAFGIDIFIAARIATMYEDWFLIPEEDRNEILHYMGIKEIKNFTREFAANKKDTGAYLKKWKDEKGNDQKSYVVKQSLFGEEGYAILKFRKFVRMQELHAFMRFVKNLNKID